MLIALVAGVVGCTTDSNTPTDSERTVQPKIGSTFVFRNDKLPDSHDSTTSTELDTLTLREVYPTFDSEKNVYSFAGGLGGILLAYRANGDVAIYRALGIGRDGLGFDVMPVASHQNTLRTDSLAFPYYVENSSAKYLGIDTLVVGAERLAAEHILIERSIADSPDSVRSKRHTEIWFIRKLGMIGKGNFDQQDLPLPADQNSQMSTLVSYSLK